MRLVRLKAEGKVIFVGDTHGDSKVSKDIVERYLKSYNRIVFLGDYVDRGYDSRGNVDFLLDARKEHPKQIYLLQGNHEGYMTQSYSDANFWERLTWDEKNRYANIFEKFPFAVSVDGIIAVHGALPNLINLASINKMRVGADNWKAFVWGDFVNTYSGFSDLRPEYTRTHFDRVMKRLRKKVLIRSHDPGVPVSMYDGRCITLFSTSSRRRGGEKTIAIADFDKHPKIRTIEDLLIYRI